MREEAREADNLRTRTKLLSEFDRGDDVERGARADIQSLRVEQLVQHRDRLLVRYVQRAVEVLDERPQVVRDAPLANTCPPARSLVPLPLQILRAHDGTYAPSVIEPPLRSLSFPPLVT